MGAGHGIGIKRNDYHRRNRKRNISMHSHSHGYNVHARGTVDADDLTLDVINLSKLRVLVENDPTMSRTTYHRKLKRNIEKSYEQRCFEYVRHKLSNYDTLTPNTDSASYIKLTERLCEHVSKVYPSLKNECDRRLRRLLNSRRGRFIRVIKKPNSLSQEQLRDFNAKEDEKWKGVLAALEEQEVANEEWEVNLTEALSSLASERLLFFPPFLSKEEIEKRRFGSGLNNNDRWWEWEREKGLKSTDGRLALAGIAEGHGDE